MADAQTDLSDYVDNLRYMVAIPGGFAASFPDTTEDMLITVLVDGFAEAQLFGLFSTHEVTEAGLVTPGLTRGEIAVVILFASVRLMRTIILNGQQSVTYKAGSAEYSTQASATVLRAILSDLTNQRNSVVDLLASGGIAQAASAFYMADQYVARICSDYSPIAVGW